MAVNVELQTAGNMWKVMAEVGKSVSKGELLFIMEVMKMEVPHEAPCDGVISEVNVSDGEEGLDAGMAAVIIDECDS